MKKIITVSAFALFGVIALSSCKKDWTCTCTINGGSGSVVYENTKKSDAKASCDSYETASKLIDPAASCSID